jgi:hypothetical protein
VDWLGEPDSAVDMGMACSWDCLEAFYLHRDDLLADRVETGAWPAAGEEWVEHRQAVGYSKAAVVVVVLEHAREVGDMLDMVTFPHMEDIAHEGMDLGHVGSLGVQ